MEREREVHWQLLEGLGLAPKMLVRAPVATSGGS
jgi:hypothetical protein